MIPDEFGYRAAEKEQAEIERTTKLCPRCNGSGELHHLASPPDPQTRVDYRCYMCAGTGVLEVDVQRLVWEEHEVDAQRMRRLDPHV